MAAVALLFLGMTVWLQWLAGSYSSELSGYPDEPAHYVTSLMVRDYIVSGFPAHPIGYAENYYLHYPKVAFGMWGPLFPCFVGIWLLASATRASVMLCMAAITAALATTVCRVVWKQYSIEAGLVAGAALVASPFIQSSTSMVMGDNFCALLDFWACLWFARYLDTGRARHSILFGLFASLSILAKPSGVALALLPLLAVAMVRRFALLRTRAFWYPAVIVLVIAGPWQVLEFRLLAGMQREMNPGWAITLLGYAVRMLGAWISPLVILGVIVRLVRPLQKVHFSSVWVSAGALAIAVWAYHFLLPVGSAEPRYMNPVLAPMLMFLMVGVHSVARRLPPAGMSVRIKAAAVMGVAALVFATQTFAIPRKPFTGFGEAAEALLVGPDLKDAVFLVSSEADGEGQFVSEVAMRERRPGHIVLRASKMLGQSDWRRQRYHLLHATPEELMEYLDSVPVRVVIVQRSPSWGRLDHHQLLLQTLKDYSSRFRLIGTFPARPGPPSNSRIEAYEALGQEGRPPGKIRIEMPYTWGKTIER